MKLKPSCNVFVLSTQVERELELCASVKHPHICELCDVIAGDNYIHLVFEFLEGADICFEIVKRAGNGFVYSEAVIRGAFVKILDFKLKCESWNTPYAQCKCEMNTKNDD
ncbi:hypothetical protein ANCCAN_15471 [Ancylostoma caninum]|uniref:Protein kinase domain-containing protein n=1 Tax=Ancylostoma caninum TaxID=29170 RepID=A0A368G2F3_ANCCA|nr:hypothetical protein ANCCAN_15471 [Ancylostoma caninum]